MTNRMHLLCRYFMTRFRYCLHLWTEFLCFVSHPHYKLKSREVNGPWITSNIVDGVAPMTLVWQNNKIRQFRFSIGNERGRRQDLALRASYIFLQTIDLMLTLLAMSLGLSELNPLMKSLLGAPVQLLTFKLAIPLLIVWVIPGKLLIPAIVFLAMVVGWDIKELLPLLF